MLRVGLLVALVVPTIVGLLGETARSAPIPPDIIVIVTDDMRESDWAALPETAAFFAEHGTTFPNFFTATPVCCPSRTTILTGMYTHNHGVLRNSGPNGGLKAFKKNGLEGHAISFALHRAGYRTALIGKFVNGTKDGGKPLAGWDQWIATSELSYYGATLNVNGRTRTYPKNERGYVTEVLRREALSFVAKTDPLTPMFLYFSPKAPHGPSTPAKGDRGAFNGARVERSPAFNEADVSDKPSMVAKLPKLSARKIRKLDKLEAKRLESLLSVDRAIVDILDAQEARGRLDDTLVFVLSDNGYLMGDHRLLTKGYPYDAAVHISMKAAGPGLAGGATDERLVLTTDIAPSIAAAAGVQLPRADGRSLLDGFTRKAVVLEAWTPKRWAAVRTADASYIEWEDGFREFYDLKRDPHELDNILAPGGSPTEAQKRRAAALADRLDDLGNCAGAACAAAEDAPLP